jgi:hypothetical protein
MQATSDTQEHPRSKSNRPCRSRLMVKDVDSRLIVEHEIIEQTETEPSGRSLAWVCDLIRGMGREDPLIVLRAMVGAGYLSFTDCSGCALPDWRFAELFRAGSASAAVRVHATPLGSRWVHGS